MRDGEQPATINHQLQHRYPEHARFCPLCAGEMAERPVAPDNRRQKVCKLCGFVSFQGPKLVAGCLVVGAGKILLLRRAIKPGLGFWTFPGGYVDLGETAAQAAVRETAEEVGVKVTLGELLGVYFDPIKPKEAVTVYRADPEIGAPKTSEEASEVRYFQPDQIPWDEIAFATTRLCLNDWIARSRRG
jgi:ADP-ribose pyrophosphatase YjhB (NUDIX family)